jgi:hypothetical protein
LDGDGVEEGEIPAARREGGRVRTTVHLEILTVACANGREGGREGGIEYPPA